MGRARGDKLASDMDRGDLGRVLDAFDAPAFVVTRLGSVVLSNEAARRAYAEPPAWLPSVIGESADAIGEHLATVTRIELGNRTLWLVLPRRGASEDERLGAALLAGLPPSLRPVADLLLAGFSDREIAERSGLTLASARTYVSRVYRRLGVRSRGELLRMALGQLPRVTDRDS